jgi:hypothetical protein
MLLLDEPMAGMNVEEKQDMCRFILDVNDQFGTTIVLIEHDMGVVMDISDRVVVLDYGKKIGDGVPDEVKNNEDVIRPISALVTRRRSEMNFFFEVLIGGLLSGVMYALVALGFVLIYKASGVFNFAQGAMVYPAALSVVGCMEKGAPLWLAILRLRDHDLVRHRDREVRAAQAGQPAAHHAVHGHHRPGLLHRRPGADDLRQRTAGARPGHRR